MANVRAKFKVETVTVHRDGHASIKLFPVVSGSEENKQFYKYTPGGAIDLSTINLLAAGAFVAGAEYYVDFTRAEIEEK